MGLGGADDGGLVAVCAKAKRAFELVEQGDPGRVEGLDDHCGRPDDLELGVVDVSPHRDQRVGGRHPVKGLPEVGDDEAHGEDVAGYDPPLGRERGGDPSAVADDPGPAIGSEGEPEQVEGEAEAASGCSEDRKVEGVKELLDVDEQRRGGGGRPRAAGSGDLRRGRLPPYDVRGGLGLPRAEDGGVAGEADLPGAGAALDNRPEDAVERRKHPNRPEADPVCLGDEWDGDDGCRAGEVAGGEGDPQEGGGDAEEALGEEGEVATVEAVERNRCAWLEQAGGVVDRGRGNVGGVGERGPPELTPGP